MPTKNEKRSRPRGPDDDKIVIVANWLCPGIQMTTTTIQQMPNAKNRSILIQKEITSFNEITSENRIIDIKSSLDTSRTVT